MIDEPQNDDVHATDRRRFTPDGELRADAPEADDAADLDVVVPDVVPAADTLMWEPVSYTHLTLPTTPYV